ncbi:sporulation initiation phosphotransferase B [Bacillus sinesaloumensis]|uniref:sporulation initiation phosphotransferase B n=1 Tax=Litchfieldia sinesaloumensis TaxID=1926280 RepID=UPI0009884F4B|nr:sporulation initiation phosphotransferase B [Bacillus sinesaloumensis]
MKTNWSTIDVLKHTRHDWLNKIQLIKGNIALNKMERVKTIIEEIVIDAQNETQLTNLQIPTFAALIMTFNWEPHKYQLDYEVVGNIRNLASHDLELTEWCTQFFILLEEAVNEMGENHLSLTIESSTEESRFFFDFSGILNDRENVTNWLEMMSRSEKSLKIIEYNVHNEEINLTLQIA